MNDFSKLSAPAALAAGQAVTNVIKVAPNAYGMDADTIQAYHTYSDLLAQAIQRAYDAEQAAKAATKAKANPRQGVVALLKNSSKQMAANYDISDQILIAIGFSPRPKPGVRPTALPAPSDLLAEALPDGTTKLRWERNGNPQGTTFVVYSSSDGQTFSIVDTTTRASLVLESAVFGVPAWYRVVAKRSGLVSPSSNLATVYAPSTSEPVRLRVA